MPTTPASSVPNTCTPLMLAEFAELAVEGAIWLNMEALTMVAYGDPVLDPDEMSFMFIEDRTMTIRELRELTDDQRNDMFIAGFRNMPHTGSQDLFELLFVRDPDALLEAFEVRWNEVANE